jgi:hypothetical protein
MHHISWRRYIGPAIAFTPFALSACGGDPAKPASTLPSFETSTVAAQDPGSTLPANWQSGVFMEIYVRGFKDSDGDGIGDLKGLTQSLDYLKDLGVSGIWLMPVSKSQDHDHGYAVTDYRDIETQYGSLADFDELLAQAHARGIGVIVDYVMNHSAAQHPAFVNSKDSAGNAYRGWYLWQSTEPSGWSIYGNDPWYSAGTGYYFAGFWDQMPDFDLTNAQVVAYHHDSMRFWLNRGVDGFRFDAVGNLVENGPSAWERQPQNYVLMNDVRRMLDGYAGRYMVCEAPGDPIGFASATACASAFAFGHSGDIEGEPERSATRGRLLPHGAVDHGHDGVQPRHLRRAAAVRPGERRHRAIQARRGHLSAAAGHALHLLRRRDRHGRCGEPQRRLEAAHADELDGQHEQCRLHDRHAVSRGVGQRRGEQRRRAIGRCELAARALQGRDRAAQGLSVARARQL